MTLLMLVNLGLAGSGVVGPAFKPAWASNANTYIGLAPPMVIPK
jgi:hypothetical protein